MKSEIGHDKMSTRQPAGHGFIEKLFLGRETYLNVFETLAFFSGKEPCLLNSSFIIS